jgi:predicted transcriptional regulator
MENKIIIGIILLAGFIMAVSAASMYVQWHILEGTVCGCDFPIELLVPTLSSAGMLIGCLVYYFLSSQFKSKERKDIKPLLSLLEDSQREIIKAISASGGRMGQSQLVRATGLNKVKVSRTVSDLEARGILKKKSAGISNQIELSEKLKELLV